MSTSVRESLSQTKPVHVEIRPRDTYQHHVTVEQAGDVLSWSFFTRRKNIAFGLFYIMTGGRESVDASPVKRRLTEGSGPPPALRSSVSGEAVARDPTSREAPLRSSTSCETLGQHPSVAGPRRSASLARSTHTAASSAGGDSLSGSVKEAIRASRGSVHIEPPAAPKPGHGSTSITGSRSLVLDDVSELSRARTLDDRSPREARSRTLDDQTARTLDDRGAHGAAPPSILPQANASMPDLRALQLATASISGANATEYIEILPVERYESFAHTVHGHYQAPVAGVYVLYFDNSYSINRSKELFLAVAVGSAAPAPQEAFGGWLLKKKQRRLQGWARRWFQLDGRGTLSYFEDRFSPCRASVDLHRCTIARIPQRLAMTIDSGQSTWHLRAVSEEDYRRWSDQLNIIRAQSAMEGLALDAASGQTSSMQAMLSHSEAVTERLHRSERLLSELRALAAREDDGNVKYLAPLEQTFQALHELYESLADYAVFLQRTGRRMSQASVGGRMLLSQQADASVDELFFDAQEMVITDISPEDDDFDDFCDDGSYFASRSEPIQEEEATMAAPTTTKITATTTATAAIRTLDVRAEEPLARIERAAAAATTTTALFRQRMPCPAPPCKVSIASILRKSLGKDMSSIAMPVALNEPLSALQRLCEELEYSELLDQAAARGDAPIERMALVAAFAVSAYAGSVHRAERKPFTPMLGETFEYEHSAKGFRLVAEKVCHRPLIVACHAQSAHWTFWQDQRGKNKSWGKSMEYTPVGNVHVLFPDTGDHFVWNKVVTCVRNILVGTKWVENVGDMVIRNVRTGDAALLSFKPNAGGGFFSSSTPAVISNEVAGSIKPASGDAPLLLAGRWDSLLCAEAPGQAPELLWRASPVPNDHMEYFGFTEFAITLNDTPEWLRPYLPPTDSRLRPDQRMLEEGRVDEAELVKQQIEQAQREARQAMEDAGETWQPTWFHHQPPTKDEPDGTWTIKDPEAYWRCRQQRSWPHVPTFW